MTRRFLIVLPLLALLVFPSFLQTRKKKAAPPTFVSCMKKAITAFEGKDFGECIRQLKKAEGIVSELRGKLLLAAMPDAPEGFEKVVKKETDADHPLAKQFMRSVGHSLEQKYKKKEGRGHINVSVVADSPLIQMLAMQFSMAKMNPQLEEIGYGDHKGLLEKKGGGLKLLILILGKHLITIDCAGITEEILFKMFDQSFVDRIAKLL